MTSLDTVIGRKMLRRDARRIEIPQSAYREIED